MLLPTQMCVTHNKPAPDKINPVLKDLFWKPRGGLWTSTLDGHTSDWMRWLKDQNYSLDDPRWGGDLWLLEPRDANVIVIAGPQDYNDLHARFPYPDNPLEGRGVKSMEKLIDWVAVSEQYDAIHVPNPHPYRMLSIEMAKEEIEEYYTAELFFNTCDAESTCWFRWCFEGEPRILERMAGHA